MNVKIISRNVGSALLVSALFMFFSILVSVANGNDSALAALTISFVITFTVGAFPFIFVRRSGHITLTDGYMIIFLSWLLSFVFGMLPYILWGGPFSVVNAWFESVSGFTTTGATILERVEDLPRSLLFWRSSTHFIGGLGIVVFLLLVIPSSSPVRLRLTNMEVSTLSKEGYAARSNRIVYTFAYVYLGIALLAFVCYCLAGMSPFDAINHAFSVCATGGFSTRTFSIGAFNSDLINVLTILFMIMASTHFALIWTAIVTRSLKPFDNPVLKFYYGTLVLASLAVAVSVKAGGAPIPWSRALMESTFQTVCYASTTGFAIADNSRWPAFACIVLMYMGVQCGMAGSTTGGLKSDRVLMFIKSIIRQVRQSIHPSTVYGVKIGRKTLRDEELYPHVLYIAVFFCFIVLSYVACLICGGGGVNSLAGSVSSLANIGPALGDLGTWGNYNGEPAAVKVIYTLDMFLGRIEIYPVLAVLSLLPGLHRR